MYHNALRPEVSTVVRPKDIVPKALGDLGSGGGVKQRVTGWDLHPGWLYSEAKVDIYYVS